MLELTQNLHAAFLKSGKTLAFAESCTGGAMAAALTAIPGASNFFLGSIVAYSNSWKERFLHVSSATLQSKGAVSRETVEEMIRGLFSLTSCDFAAAVSGIAGPTGGTVEKPVGTLFFAVGRRGEPIEIKRVQAPSGRKEAIDFATQSVFKALLEKL